jgi:hypothetical protein
MPPRRSEKDQAALYDGVRQWIANLATWNEPALRKLLHGTGKAQARWLAMHAETNAPPDIPKWINTVKTFGPSWGTWGSFLSNLPPPNTEGADGGEGGGGGGGAGAAASSSASGAGAAASSSASTALVQFEAVTMDVELGDNDDDDGGGGDDCGFCGVFLMGDLMRITDVLLGGAADLCGLGIGDTVRAINGAGATDTALRAALSNAGSVEFSVIRKPHGTGTVCEYCGKILGEGTCYRQRQ